MELLSYEGVVRSQKKMLKLYHILSNIGQYIIGIRRNDIKYLLAMIMPHYEYEDNSTIREPHTKKRRSCKKKKID